MTIGSSMSSGYCSLDEDLEDCFFTAKTSFFRSTPNKVPAKVTAEKLVGRAVLGGRWGGGGLPARGDVGVLARLAAGAAKISLQLESGQSCWWGGGLDLPLAGSPLLCRGSALLQIFLGYVSTFCVPGWPLPGGSTVEEPSLNVGFSALGGAGSSPASCHPRVRLAARDMWFGLAKYASLVKIVPLRWIGRWESYRTKLICELINTVMNLVLFWALGCMCTCLGAGRDFCIGNADKAASRLSVYLKKNKHKNIPIINFGAPTRTEHKRRRREGAAAEVGVSLRNKSPAALRDEI